MNFAKRTDVSPELRAEALATIGTWPNPSVLDRVDGRYRGKIERNPALVVGKVKANIDAFLQSTNADILVGTSSMLSELNIKDYNPQLEKIMQQNSSPAVRSAMLSALHKLKYEKIEAVIKRGMEDKDGSVRTAAIGLLNELNVTQQNLPGIVDPIFRKGTVEEQQQLLRVLGEMPLGQSEPVLDGLLDQLSARKLSPTLTLDLMEAIDSTHSEKLITRLKPLRPTGNTSDAFMETLYGGDGRRGARYFFTNSTGQCVRCHSVGEQGGTVGPNLGDIGNTLSREQLLQALIEPSARLSPGFGSVKLTLQDNQVVTGILLEETKSELTLKTSEAEPMEVPITRIGKRENLPSGMPPMRTLMSKREIRDMIEFLSNLKKEKGK
jgi:putative heme-binding domain-containing protein